MAAYDHLSPQQFPTEAARKSAERQFILKNHPDRGGDHETFVRGLDTIRRAPVAPDDEGTSVGGTMARPRQRRGSDYRPTVGSMFSGRRTPQSTPEERARFQARAERQEAEDARDRSRRRRGAN